MCSRYYNYVYCDNCTDGRFECSAYTLSRSFRRRSGWVKSALTVAQIVLAILVVLGVLLQTPSASGLGGTIGGGGDAGGGYRRRRGLERSLLRGTVVFIVLFAAVSVGIAYISRNG